MVDLLDILPHELRYVSAVNSGITYDPGSNSPVTFTSRKHPLRPPLRFLDFSQRSRFFISFFFFFSLLFDVVHSHSLCDALTELPEPLDWLSAMTTLCLSECAALRGLPVLSLFHLAALTTWNGGFPSRWVISVGAEC